MNTLESVDAQLRAVQTFFDELADLHPLLPQGTFTAANDEQAALQA